MTKKKVTTLADDLLSVYKDMGGREHLKTLAKDEKFLKTLLTEHMRLQMREKELELTANRGPQKTALLIIKGLHDVPTKVVAGKDVPPEVMKLQQSIFPDRTTLVDDDVMEEAAE